MVYSYEDVGLTAYCIAPGLNRLGIKQEMSSCFCFRILEFVFVYRGCIRMATNPFYTPAGIAMQANGVMLTHRGLSRASHSRSTGKLEPILP